MLHLSIDSIKEYEIEIQTSLSRLEKVIRWEYKEFEENDFSVAKVQVIHHR